MTDIDFMRRTTLGDQLKRIARHYPNRAALIYYANNGQRQVMTYKELNCRANDFAHTLENLGVGKGTVVCMYADNTPDYGVVLYACLKIGAVLSGINLRLTDSEIISDVNLCQPFLMICEAQFAERISGISAELSCVSNYITLGKGEKPSRLSKSWLWVDTSEYNAAAEEPFCDLTENDVAVLLRTSGSEARAKVAVTTHKNYLQGALFSYAVHTRLSEDDIYFCSLPFYSTGGFVNLVILTQLRATIVLMDKSQCTNILKIIAEERVTYIGHTTTFYLRLLQHPDFDQYDLTSLRICCVFSGGFTKEMIERYKKASPKLIWGTGWGQTELTGACCQCFFESVDEIPENDFSWIGTPSPTAEIKLVDENGNESDLGEALCRAPHVMMGYYNDEDLTEKVFKDGWLHTGDILRVNKDGQYFFVGRVKEIIKTGGFNVSSFEVEKVLNSHPAVCCSAVVGIPDKIWIEKVTAVVVLEKEHITDADELTRYLRTKLAGYKVPKQFYFVGSLPVDGGGKIRTREVKDMIIKTAGFDHPQIIGDA